MNVFVTGATGGIGAGLVSRLLDDGCALSLLTRNPDGIAVRGHVRIIPGDLLAPESYAHALSACEAVIHMAAVTHAAKAERYFRVNAEGTRRLVKAAAGLPGRFVFVSTRAVGEACGAYGASKAEAERIVRTSGLDWTIVRPAEVYGAAKGEAVAKVVESVLSSPFIPVPGDGSHTLAPVLLEDVLGGIAAALVRPEASENIYNLAGPEETTYLEFVRAIMARRGIRKPLVRIPLCILRLAALCFSLLPMDRPPLVRDQIPRLLGPKDSDIAPARRDLDFQPQSVPDAIRSFSTGR